MRVAVFGSSEPRPGDPAYALAEELGRRLAGAGHTVVTGGYGGVMEAASRGARAAGGAAIGVTCGIFRDRRPNAYVTEHVPTADLHLRTRELIERADAFVVLPGKAGTLAELAFLWALQRAGCLASRRVILLGGLWVSVLADLERRGVLEAAQIEATQRVRTPEAALAALGQDGNNA